MVHPRTNQGTGGTHFTTETGKEVAAKRYSPNPDLPSVSLDAHGITGDDAEEDEGQEESKGSQHTLPGYLYLKTKGIQGKNGENAGKRHPGVCVFVCAATFHVLGVIQPGLRVRAPGCLGVVSFSFLLLKCF
jgi:hypothetical protein